MKKKAIALFLVLVMVASAFPLMAFATAETEPARMDLEVKDTFTFGHYEQDGKYNNGEEPIEWIVLERDGDSILAVSKYILDCRRYNDIRVETTWATSDIREWLNEDFLEEAFTEEEQELIALTTIDNGVYEETEDMVFLLSRSEVKHNFAQNKDVTAYATKYAIDKKVYPRLHNGAARYWLRTNGNKSWFNAMFASHLDTGWDENGAAMTLAAGVRPAIWLKAD